MFKKSLFNLIAMVALLTISLCSEVRAENGFNFDFALPLFGKQEISFEKTKQADYNFQLMKKYILEQDGNVIAQFHAINRWLNLIKLSDAPRQKELISFGDQFFSTKDKKKPSNEERLREIFYKGLLLSRDKSVDVENNKDEELENLLLDSEEDLKDSPDYWIAKGIIFHTLKNRPNNYFSLMKPEEDLKIALSLIPRSAQYYYVMGQCFRFLGTSDSSLFLSIASYEKASSLDSKNGKLQNSLLSIYMGLHEDYHAKDKREPFWLEEAVYKKILEMSPGNPHALNNLGYLYAEYGVNTELALKLCLKAVEVMPENPGFYDSLGWAAFKNKDVKLAEEALLKSISMRGNVYESRYHLATVYYTSNQLDKAAEQYEQSILLRPDSAEALNNLAYLYTEQDRNIQKALSMAITANNLEPNNASYLDTLGWAYYKSGDLENALSNLLKANNIVPGSGEILLHIGRVYLDKSDFESALTFVKEAFKADPNMSDQDGTLYLTIRLKAYHEAMADYHGLLGERAEMNKVINILLEISRLYQEEKLYEKSMEITQICSDLKNGVKTLGEPLLNSYKLLKPLNKKEDEKEEIKEESENTKVAEAEEDKKQATSETKEEKAETEVALLDFPVLPTENNCPMAVSFCSDMFKKLGIIFPRFNNFENCNITLFVDRLLFPGKSVVLRISSDKEDVKSLQLNLLKMFFPYKTRKIDIQKEDVNSLSTKFGKLHCWVYNDSVYLSKKELTQDSLEAYSKILPFRKDYLMELYFDWEQFKNRIPNTFIGFFKNPIEPFNRLQASYSYSRGNVNEFIVGSTLQEINDSFMKKMARRLFQFKLDAKEIDLQTTIKMQKENNLVYISTDFEDVINWLSGKYNSILKFLPLFYPVK